MEGHKAVRMLRNGIGTLALLAGLVGCSNDAVYDQYNSMPADGWYVDSAITFDVLITDTSKAYVAETMLRHDEHYPFANIYLFRSIEAPEGGAYTDTVEYILAEPNGKWTGEGFGALKSHVWMFRKQAMRFKQTGIYKFSFKQGMRDNPLVGVADFGLRISAVKEK